MGEEGENDSWRLERVKRGWDGVGGGGESVARVEGTVMEIDNRHYTCMYLLLCM